MAKRFLIGLLAVLAAAMPAFAQSTVSGKIVDTKGEGIPGANVIISGTRTGAISDLDGSYKLTGVSSKAVLEFSCLGYATKKVAVEGKSVINVVLEEDSEFLDDVVVIGYGTARKKDLTGSISAVNGDVIASQANASVTRSLEGQVAGLQVSSLDGQPGLDVGIRIRGIGTSSANNANALIIIDGVPATDGTNPLSSLNSKDIESLTVLKDAASTALYGSRGANGVILVTTKTGKEGKTKISFEGRWGINAIGANAHFDKIGDGGSHEIYEFYWDAIYNSAYYGKDAALALAGDAAGAAEFASQHLFNYVGSGSEWGRNGLGNLMQYDVPGAKFTTTGSGSTESATMSGKYLIGTDGKLNPEAQLKWVGETLEDALITNRFRQEYNVSASGGSDKMDYHISLGYLSDPSYVATSAFDRYTARANVNAQITSWLKAGAKFGYTHRKTNSLATRWGRNPGYTMENPFSWVDNSTALDIVYALDENGNYIKGANGQNLYFTTDPSKSTTPTANTYSPVGPTTNGMNSRNIDYLLYYKQQEDSQVFDDLNTSGYVRASFLKHFTAEVNLSYNTNFGLRTRYYNAETAANRIGASLGSAIHKSRTQYSTLNTQQLVNYNQNFDKHHVDAMVGHEFYKYNYESMEYGSAHALINGFKGFCNFLGLQSYSTFGTSWGGGLNEMALESYLGRANYIYDDKYYVSASIRRDGSSKFKTNDTRWGTFWSVGAGWRISSEKFMEGTKSWLDNLKFRASYGVLGNQNGIPMYAGYQTWSYGVASWAGSGTSTYPSAVKLSKGGWVNSALTWEKVHTTDAGLDFTLFGGKVSGTFDWYNKHTVNAFFNKNMSYLASGQASALLNCAGIRNNGIELELSWQPVKTNDWDVLFSTNGTHYNTRITSVPDGTGSEALNGCWLASDDGWSISGQGSSSGKEFLRGVGKDYYNLYLYKYGGVAGNPGKTYYDASGKAYTGYTKGDPDAGKPLFYHRVTAEEAEKGMFGGAKAGTDILTTNTNTDFCTRYEVGDALPEWIGGFTTNVRYKNFDLGIVFTYQIGGKFFSVDYASGESGKYMAGNNIAQPAAVSRELLNNTWSEENQSAKFPMVYYNSAVTQSGCTLGSWNYTDLALFDASYLSIKNITLGYTLPSNLTKKIHISNLRVYASCDNPVLLYSHSGIDPRWSITGGMAVGAYSYPYLSVYTFGVNLDF